MINTITITNSRNESVILDLFDPFSSGFAIQQVDGLGPVNTNINTADYAYKPGAFYLGSRQSTRNIVFDLVFLDTVGTIEQVRHLSYQYWPIGERIDILVSTDTRELYTNGYVESNEPAIWDAEHEGCQISVICESPFFVSPNINVNKLSDIRNSFHFPFASTEDPELTFGYADVHDYIVAVNNGDVETGAIFELRPSVPVDNISIFRYGVTEPIFKIKNTLEAGDVLTINSETGSKSITLRRNDKEYNAINYLDYSNGIIWPTLRRGDNAFSVAYTSFQTSSQIATIPTYSMQLLDVLGNSFFSSIKMEFDSFSPIKSINTYRSGSDQSSYDTFKTDILTETYKVTTDKSPQAGTTYYIKTSENPNVYEVAVIVKGFTPGVTYYVKTESGYSGFYKGTFDPISGVISSTHDIATAKSYSSVSSESAGGGIYYHIFSGGPFTQEELQSMYDRDGSSCNENYIFGGHYPPETPALNTVYIQKKTTGKATTYHLIITNDTYLTTPSVDGLKIRYPKASPLELYFTTVSIIAYSGENNIWNDTNYGTDIRGNITEIDYRTPITGSDQLTLTIKHKNKYLGV